MLQLARAQYELALAAENRRQALEVQRENSGRPAYANLTYRTTGTGHMVIAAPLNFPVSFTAEPAITSGCSVLRGPGNGWHYPVVTAGIYRWKIDSKGLYVGAYPYFVVRCDRTSESVNTVTDAQNFFRERNLEAQIKLAGIDRSNANDYREYLVLRQQVEVARLELIRAERFQLAPTPSPVVVHHLLFQQQAIKDIGDQAQDAILYMDKVYRGDGVSASRVLNLSEYTEYLTTRTPGSAQR